MDLNKYIRIGSNYYDKTKYNIPEIIKQKKQYDKRKIREHIIASKKYEKQKLKNKLIPEKQLAIENLKWLNELLKGNIKSYEYDTHDKIIKEINKELELIKEIDRILEGLNG